MIPITHPKVAGFEPRWARFAGFSVLFNSHGDSAFLDGLAWTIEHLGRNDLIRRHLFCPLPPPSFHVTVWDGVNAENVDHLPASQRESWGRFLAGMPHPQTPAPAALGLVTHSILMQRPPQPIDFVFDDWTIWGESVLVTRLKAADEVSAARLATLRADRTELDTRFREALGIGADHTYEPHVSLGYFADPAGARSAMRELVGWNALAKERLGHTRLTFSTLGIYGFADMSAFVRLGT